MTESDIDLLRQIARGDETFELSTSNDADPAEFDRLVTRLEQLETRGAVTLCVFRREGPGPTPPSAWAHARVTTAGRRLLVGRRTG